MKDKVVVGSWPLSGDFGFVSLSNICDVLEHCYNMGFKEFDTAPSYGNGFMEFCLGKIFRNKPEVRINTKIGNIPFRGKSFHLNDLKQSLKDSLDRLTGLKINVLFLHNPRDDVEDFQQLLDYMRELKSKGIIRYMGISKGKNFNYEDVVDLSQFDVIQDDMNLLYCPTTNVPHNTVFMARSPLASGILSGKMKENVVFTPDDHRSNWLKGKRLSSLLERVEVIRQISNIEIGTIARKFLLQNKQVDKVMFGVKSIDHINDIKTDLETPPLEQSLIDTLTNLYINDFGLIEEKHLGY